MVFIDFREIRIRRFTVNRTERRLRLIQRVLNFNTRVSCNTHCLCVSLSEMYNILTSIFVFSFGCSMLVLVLKTMKIIVLSNRNIITRIYFICNRRNVLFRGSFNRYNRIFYRLGFRLQIKNNTVGLLSSQARHCEYIFRCTHFGRVLDLNLTVAALHTDGVSSLNSPNKRPYLFGVRDKIITNRDEKYVLFV